MNDVVTAAQISVLVTGFGPFPGVPSNPTIAILRLLGERGVDGVPLELATLPVTFAGVAPALRAAATCRPRAILLLGLARRRTSLSVETRAVNRRGTAVPDNDGLVPAAASLVVEGGPAEFAATWPAEQTCEALLARGHRASLSDDAGDYVCNAALYHALHEGLAPTIGFLHVPPLGCRGEQPTIESLTEAARLAVSIMAGPAAAATPPPPARGDARQAPDRKR